MCFWIANYCYVPLRYVRWILWHRSRNEPYAEHRYISDDPPSIHEESSPRIYFRRARHHVYTYSSAPNKKFAFRWFIKIRSIPLFRFAISIITFNFLSSSDHLQPSLWCIQYTMEPIIAFSASVSWKFWKRLGIISPICSTCRKTIKGETRGETTDFVHDQRFIVINGN